MASLTTSSLHYLTSLATETGDVATSTTQASGPSYTGDPVSYDDGYYRSDTPMVYPFTTSSFPLALTTAILFLILTILHAYLCCKKKTVFFVITIYASLGLFCLALRFANHC